MKLDPTAENFGEELETLKASAALALGEAKLERGNTAILELARKKAVESHRQIGRITERRIRPILKQLRADGFNTYRALADVQTERGIRPPRSQHWNATSVRNIETRHSDE